ncbi:MAG: lysophospholipid acyltransferase family protein [Steroidobacteraceae bacterium]
MPQDTTRSPRPLHALALLPFRLVFTVYAGGLFLILGSSTLLIALVLPGLERRRAAARRMARLLLAVVGMRPAVRGLEHLPAGQCVIVANHASYLDGPVFTAVLPARFGFVIKREMARVPLAGAFLKRIGSQFVERVDRRRGAADALRVLRTATRGHSLVFFPEGTFTPTPGLMKFHSGAFTTAVRAGCPVVPAIVRGTRTALSPRGALPRPARIEVQFLPPLAPPAGEPARAAAQLREQARAAILSLLDEPDLSSHVAPVPPADLVQGVGDLPE